MSSWTYKPGQNPVPSEEERQRIEGLRDCCIWCGLSKEGGKAHLWPGDCIRLLKEKVEELETINEDLCRQLPHEEYTADLAYDAYRESNG